MKGANLSLRILCLYLFIVKVKEKKITYELAPSKNFKVHTYDHSICPGLTGYKNPRNTVLWILLHPLYSPDVALSDYHLFCSMQRALYEEWFIYLTEIKN